MTLDEIRLLPAEEAIAQLCLHIATNPEDDEAYLLRGMRYWAMSERSKAIHDYLAAIRINPESKARQALQAANAILDYRNPDLLNP